MTRLGRKLKMPTALLSVLCAAGLVTGAAAQDNGFQLDDRDLEMANEKLLAAEAQLLKSLKSGQNTAPSKPTGEPAVERANINWESRLERKVIPPPQKSKAARFNEISQEIAGELETLQNKNMSLNKKVKDANRSLSEIKGSQSEIQSRLAAKESRLVASDRRIEQLLSKVKELRDQLLVAETEIERLSGIIEERNSTSLNYKRVQRSPRRGSNDNPLYSEEQNIKSSPDMPVATVMVDKANLRTGPGKNNSPLMTVPKGTRLAVEHRVSDWYRVITPTGTRAWVNAEVVMFGKNVKSGPTRTVAVRGYEPDIEEEAFEFISKRHRR